MSDASIWKPGSDVPLVTNEVNVFQAYVATGGQTVFTLTDFVYVPNSDAMRVTVNGVQQIPGRDFTETSGTEVTLAFAADADDDVVLWGVTSAEYSTAAQIAATFAGQITVDTFSGTGAQVDFTLSTTPPDENATYVYVNGLYQAKGTYSVAGTTLSFAVAPALGTNNIEVITHVPGSATSEFVTLTGIQTVSNKTFVAPVLGAATATSINGIEMILPSADSIGIGTDALDSQTTGSTNTAFGYKALTTVTTQTGNTAIGHQAGIQNQGSGNTLIGAGAGGQAGPYNFNGSNNVCIGKNAGVYLAGATSSISQCVCVGVEAGDVSSSNTNCIIIGYQAKPSLTNSNNEITLGNTSITSFRIPGLGLTTTGKTGTNKFVLDTSPTLITPTFSGNTIVTGGTFTTRGLTDSATATALTLSGSGANSLTIANGTTVKLTTNAGGLSFNPGNSGTTSVLFPAVASAANWVSIYGSATGAGVTVTAQGADTDVGLVLGSKGAENIYLYAGGAFQVVIDGTASANRYITLTGSNGGNPTIGTSGGGLRIAPATGFADISGTGNAGLTISAAAASVALVSLYVNSAETARIASSADGMTFATGASAVSQVVITHTASTDRYITLTGSNGGNPTIGTSAGSLAISVPLTCGGGIQAKSATATPAGGTVGFFMGSDSVGIYWGSGAPTVSAAKGALYLRTDGSATNNRMYVNTDGVTTWTAVTTAA